MKKRIISLLLAAALAASLCACGEQQTADGGSLRLYCPADLSEQNKSAGGGDAVQGIAIPWADITAGDRGRQQQGNDTLFHASSPLSASGRYTVNTVPTPFAPWPAEMVPPRFSMVSFTMDSPSPVPPTSRERILSTR